VMIGVALYLGYRGVTKKFLEDSKTAEMGPRTRQWFSAVGTIGYLARMIVFGLVGIFLVKAAIDFNPKKAVGLDGALASILHRSYGPLALGVVAAGLIAFALYSVSDARYRKI
jgi:L-cystine uptake protein TcyP (sodium:dicarboxylate symporter family)